MGNDPSKSSSPATPTANRPQQHQQAAAAADADADADFSSGFKHRLHIHRQLGPRPAQASALPPTTHNDFAGIALISILSAEMHFEDKWLACLSLGYQTFRTHISNHTDKPVWNSEKKLLLETNGPRVARISIFETNRVSSNNLIGFCDVDLLNYFSRDSDSKDEVLNLADPSSPDTIVGKVSISCKIEDPIETEMSFARRILSIMDCNGDGKLSFSEFSELADAFGNKLAAEKKEALFRAADKNGDDVVSIDELATLLATQHEK